MTGKEFFKDWYPYIDNNSLSKALIGIQKDAFFPLAQDVFKVFKLLNAKDVKVMIVGQDPYPQPGMATGIAFGNPKGTPDCKLSPSLQVIKEAVIDYSIPHGLYGFDETLEDWVSQGVFLLNTSLTVAENKPGSHTLLWREFISKLLYKFSKEHIGIIYVLMGKQAQSFKQYISPISSNIIECYHPAYYWRNNVRMPGEVFDKVNNLLYSVSKEKINWYYEDKW